MSKRRYEYKFVRLSSDKLWFTQTRTPSQETRESYEDVVHQYADEGWRLVQIFAPGLGFEGAAAYFELIFERELA